MRFEKQGF